MKNPTKAELAAELASLRAEVDSLRAEKAAAGRMVRTLGYEKCITVPLLSCQLDPLRDWIEGRACQCFDGELVSGNHRDGGEFEVAIESDGKLPGVCGFLVCGGYQTECGTSVSRIFGLIRV